MDKKGKLLTMKNHVKKEDNEHDAKTLQTSVCIWIKWNIGKISTVILNLYFDRIWFKGISSER